MKLKGSLRATAKELREISRKKVSKRGGAKRKRGKSTMNSWTEFREKIERKNGNNLRGDDLINALEKFVAKI